MYKDISTSDIHLRPFIVLNFRISPYIHLTNITFVIKTIALQLSKTVRAVALEHI